MRFSAWLGFKVGEFVWFLLHEVFDLKQPDAPWSGR